MFKKPTQEPKKTFQLHTCILHENCAFSEYTVKMKICDLGDIWYLLICTINPQFHEHNTYFFGHTV